MRNRFGLLITTIFLAACGNGGLFGSHGGGYNLAQMYDNSVGIPAAFNATGLCTGSISLVSNPLYTAQNSGTGTIQPASLLMYGNFGVTDPNSICGPGNFGGTVTPPLTTISNLNSLPTAAVVGSSGTFYTYTQSSNGVQTNTGTVTWTFTGSPPNPILTLTDTNLNYPSGTSNYTMVRTYTISSTAAYTMTATGLSIAVAGANGGTITGTVTTTPMPALNLQAAFQTFDSAGWNTTFSVTGSCTGTLLQEQSAISATTTTFNGGTAYPATYTQTGSLLPSPSGNASFCTSGPFSGSQTSTNYYNSNTTPVQLGNSTPSIYSNVSAPTTSLSSGPVYSTFYTYTQPNNPAVAGKIINSIAPPANANSQPVLFSYELNSNTSGAPLNYGDVSVYTVNANNTLSLIGYSYTDSSGNHIVGY
jgi:hypothetical protein